MKPLIGKIISLLFLLLTCTNVYPALVTLTFDEVTLQDDVNGLAIQGVTFAYDGTFSNYHGLSGPLDAQFLSRPHLDGHTDGALTLDFASPTPVLEFSIAYRNDQSYTAAATVELFDENLSLIGQFDVETTPLVVFTEGQFTYSGTPIRRAVISFDETINDFFHLDNLMFKLPECENKKRREERSRTR